jgi:GNAT superfamily N-acetyltransferase
VNFSVVTFHPSLVEYAVGLQAKHSNELGFLPRAVFERGAENGQLFLGLLNGEPCGYILAGSGFQGVLRRWQVCIQYDARRRLYGAMLVAAVEKYGEDRGCWRSEVRCASDLEANAFWASVGYTLTGEEPCGEARRPRRSHINIWTKPLHPAIPATEWANGRPRIYQTNADRQRAYRDRLALRKPAVVPPAGKLRNSVASTS